MSGLEVTAKPVLEPMIRGNRTVLGLRQQLDVAAWAAKTVVAVEQHEPSATITLPSDRELIMKERRPPHHYRVRLAYRDAYLEPLVIKTLVARSADAPDERPNVFVTLFAIGFLIVQVWGGHGADLDGIMTRAGTKTGRAIMVWPPVPGNVEWPPVTPVGDDSLDEFTAEVAPWHDDSPGMAEWRAMRRAASARGLATQERLGSETEPDVGSKTGARPPGGFASRS
jgi:hypothetical protein